MTTAVRATVDRDPRDGGRAGPVRPIRGRRARSGPGWAFVAPYALLLAAFGVAPAVYGVYQAFVVVPVVGAPYYSLTDNFTAVLRDFRLLPAMANVGLYLLVWLPLLLLVVFGVALVLDARRTRFAALTRFVAYLPGSIAGAAAALLWLFLFSPAVSPIGPLLAPFADPDGTFLSDGRMPLVLAVMGVAAGGGGWIVMLHGALTAIPTEVLEAARLDGASAWQTVRRIKLPMIRRYVAFILIVSLANGFQVFVEPQVMGAAAAGRISRTWSVNQLVFTYATAESNYGRAAALSVLLLAVCVVAAVVVVRRTGFYRVQR